MKKNMSLLLVLTMVVIMVCAINLPALAVTTNQYLDINLSDVQNGDKGSLSDLTMFGSTKTNKVITIEKSAADLLIKKGQTLSVDLDGWVVKFSPSIFQCDAIAKAVALGDPVSYRLTINTSPSTNITTYFSDSAQGAKGNYRLEDGAITVDAEILSAGTDYYAITNLAKPIQITYNYSWDISDSNAKESKLTYAWIDIDAAKNGKNVTWQTMNSAVDTAKDTFTASLTKGVGYYLAVSSTNGMTASSTDSGNTGSGTPTDTYVPIPDGYWATSDITNMQNSLVVPYSLSGISLDAPITRGQFASYVVNALKLSPNTVQSGKFTDVSTNNAYYTAIYTGVASGIFKGVTATTFAPNAKISRQEMAVMFQRAMECKAVTINKDTAKVNAFTDVKSISSWALESAAIVVNAEIIKGQNGTYFAPKANATWAESVVMLSRLYEQLY